MEQLNEAIQDPEGKNRLEKSVSEQLQSSYSYAILTTKVCPITIQPIWQEDLIFPITIENLLHFQELKMSLFVRDEDYDETNDTNTYDELGMLEFPFSSLFAVVPFAYAPNPPLPAMLSKATSNGFFLHSVTG